LDLVVRIQSFSYDVFSGFSTDLTFTIFATRGQTASGICAFGCAPPSNVTPTSEVLLEVRAPTHADDGDRTDDFRKRRHLAANLTALARCAHFDAASIQFSNHTTTEDFVVMRLGDVRTEDTT